MFRTMLQIHTALFALIGAIASTLMYLKGAMALLPMYGIIVLIGVAFAVAVAGIRNL